MQYRDYSPVEECAHCRPFNGFHDFDCPMHGLKDARCKVVVQPVATDDVLTGEAPSDDFSYAIVAVDASGEGWVLDASPGFYDRDVLSCGASCDDNGVVVGDGKELLPMGVYRATGILRRPTDGEDGETLFDSWEPLWRDGWRPHASDCARNNGPAEVAGPCDCGVEQEEPPALPGVVRAFERVGA